MNLKITLLQLLASNSGIPEREPSLFNAVVVQSKHSPTKYEFQVALRQCEDKGWVVGVHNDLLDVVSWKITDAGRLALAEIS